MKKKFLWVLILFLGCTVSSSAQSLQMMLDEYNSAKHIRTAACTRHMPHSEQSLLLHSLSVGMIGYIDFWAGPIIKKDKNGFLVTLFDGRNKKDLYVRMKTDALVGDRITISGLIRIVGTKKIQGVEILALEVLDSEKICRLMEENLENWGVQFREWTVSKEKIWAKFVERKGNFLILELENGTEKKIQRSKISSADEKKLTDEMKLSAAIKELAAFRTWKINGIKIYARIALVLGDDWEVVLVDEEKCCENFSFDELSDEDVAFILKLNQRFAKIK